ncbi:MAG: hypothetical protein QM765_50115 [Myxococcales bacterium]
MRTLCAMAVSLLAAAPAWAGPPFETDDPEPVEPRHVELYLSATGRRAGNEWTGLLPLVEGNVGAAPDLQLHVLVPMAFHRQNGRGILWGPGDVELGAKVRLVHESKYVPQVGVFPLLEIPTGSADRRLGRGTLEAFLPVWIQKSFGAWTTYGGAGFRISSETSSWFFGWQVQRRFLDRLLVGIEVVHETGEDSDTRFNAGLVVDWTDHHHVLFSAGRSIGTATTFQAYLGWLVTLGREEEGERPKPD